MKKVDSSQIQPRQICDTFADGLRYSLNIGENQGSVSAIPLYQCSLRHEPRSKRQTLEEQEFWKMYLKS